jgi:hypothetical protein
MTDILASAVGARQKVADTGLAGFALQNGTPNIISWTAPNDGQVHSVEVIESIRVTNAETGGATQEAYTPPDGNPITKASDAGGHGVGTFTQRFTLLMAPNTTFTHQQSSALSLGAAIAWVQLWAA